MMELWSKISYMVQLIFASLLFIFPAREKRKFALKILICSVGLILVSYVLNSIHIYDECYIGWLFYWGYYIIACILLAWVGVGGNLLCAIYCAVCACAVQHVAFNIYIICGILWVTNSIWTGMMYLLIYAVVYGMFYFFLARKLIERGRFTVNIGALFPIVTIIVLVWVMSLMEVSNRSGFEAGIWQRIFYRILDALCCFYVLWVQLNQKETGKLQREIAGINHAWHQQIKQYQITKDTIESINRKCHDLKHQIRAIKRMTDEGKKEAFLNNLESDIMIYDTALKTGNKALDTVLMEKGLICKNRDIQWSCMADGSRLNFMRLEDIYAIFGNALDNSIYAAMEIVNAEKRVVSVRIINRNNLIIIQIQNYFEGELRFENGLPITTKSDKNEHGYGMKSIQHTAEKYNGTVTVSAENHIFMLQILLPVISSF